MEEEKDPDDQDDQDDCRAGRVRGECVGIGVNGGDESEGAPCACRPSGQLVRPPDC